MEDEPFLFPLLVPHGHDLITEACNKATPTTLTSWEHGNASNGNGSSGAISVAMGCDDGSIFLFHPEETIIASSELSPVDQLPTSKSLSQSQSQSQSQGPPNQKITPFSNLTHLNRVPSPAPSTTSSSYFNSRASGASKLQPSKSRVQAGISNEQVEAPKNYVDFDEEPTKLKQMLKTREATKERGFIEGLLPSLHLGHGHSRQTSSEAGPPQRLEIPSNASTNPATPIISSASTSPPASPLPPRSQRATSSAGTKRVSNALKLVAHTFPPRFGYGRGITALQPMENGTVLASLQECGTLGLYSTSDGKHISSVQLSSTTMKPPQGAPIVETPIQCAWSWSTVSLNTVGETTFLLLSASDSNANWESATPKTRVAVVRVLNSIARKSAAPSEYLSKIGEWIVESPLENVGMAVNASGEPLFYHIASSKQLLFSRIRILDRVQLTVPPPIPEDSSINTIMTTIPIPNPFKSRRPRISRPTSVYDVRKDEEGLIELETPASFSGLEFAAGEDFRIWLQRIAEDEVLVAWNEQLVKVFLIKQAGLIQLGSLDVPNVQSVHSILPYMVLLRGEEEDTIYRIHADTAEQLELLGKTTDIDPEAIFTILNSRLLFTTVSSRGHRRLESFDISDGQLVASTKRQRLWRGIDVESTSKGVRVTSMLPIDLAVILIGCDDGYIRRTTYTELFDDQSKSVPIGETSDQALDAKIISLYLTRNEHTGEYYVIGGTDGGTIAVWAFQSLRLLAKWVVFATPLMSVVRLVDDSVGRLKGCILCIAMGGTLAIITLDGLEVTLIVPGGPGRLEKVCLGEDNLILLYSNDVARLWDMKTQEFWRSMARDKTETLLEQGGWFETLVEPEGPSFTSGPIGCVERSYSNPDGANALVLDLRALLPVAPFAGQNQPPPKTPPSHHEFLQLLTASCLSVGLDESIDKLAQDVLGIMATNTNGGICSYGKAPTLINNNSSTGPWTISSEYTGYRLLVMCSLLRSRLGLGEDDADINTVLTYYIASLPEAVGKQYCPPSLDLLVPFWFDSNSDIRTSARALFDAAIGQLTDEEVAVTVADYQHRLPCLQPDVHKETPWAVTALAVAGNIAIARHACISTSVITDIATSITLYLHDESSAHRVLAIDLSSHGLQIWQHYTDTMEIMRSLFELATLPRKEEGPTIRNPRAQARLAVLHIASTSTHLFMTKLLLDIMHPKTPEHNRAIMQLLAFLIRKKPLVLYPNLSRLLEAVVKSMDPSSASRDAVQDAATAILADVVKTYPTVDFHAPSQRLVVGTHEGAAILYDLKTATRLYVLEGHKKRVTACSFSPDGRRLVTLSLEESVVMVWKVGTSFTSFFYPGAPPRQGHAGSEPFKTLSFNVGDEAHMTTAATLEWVGFDWPTERNARLRIRDSTLTFNT